MPTPTFRPLFAFADDHAALVEIKRLDLPPDSPKGRVYHWLWLDGDAPTALTFRAMEREPLQYRLFAEGELWFDDSEGTLQLTGQPRRQLPACGEAGLAPRWQAAIAAYLAAQG
jgi:hypothetical protein